MQRMTKTLQVNKYQNGGPLFNATGTVAKSSQKKRIAIFKEYCRKHPTQSTWGYSSKDYPKGIKVVDSIKTIYCFPTKTGCTTTKFLMYNLEHGTNESAADHQLGWIHKQDYRFLKDYSKEEAEIRLATYNKLIVVRDPLERYTCTSPSEKEKETERVEYDFIAHTDTLAEDLRLFLHKIGVVGKDYLLPTQHPTRAKTNFGITFRDVPTEDLRRIGEIYKPDFDTFGYSFEEDLALIEDLRRDTVQ
uniref:Carbohydrate sulfotransferase n=1 Tax=Branchiostoma floridae TaxID=7739 RepID=C3Y6X5_BRAFL|eukprot:XP_002608075.1 hypothetical protein BRAFLDRAFT_91447 [Branchiostoma floridae]